MSDDAQRFAAFLKGLSELPPYEAVVYRGIDANTAPFSDDDRVLFMVIETRPEDRYKPLSHQPMQSIFNAGHTAAKFITTEPAVTISSPGKFVGPIF